MVEIRQVIIGKGKGETQVLIKTFAQRKIPRRHKCLDLNRVHIAHLNLLRAPKRVAIFTGAADRALA